MNERTNRFRAFRAAMIAAIALVGIAASPSHATSTTAAPNVVVNGGFETPAVVHASTFDIMPRGSNALAPWAIGGLSIGLVKGYWQAAEGLQSLDLGAGSISQVFPTEPGRNYLLSFKYSRNPYRRRGTPKMTVRWGPSASGPFSLKEQFTYAGTATKANMNWQRVERTVRATSTSTYFSFASSVDDDAADQSDNGDSRGTGREIIGLGMALDDVSVTLVPDIAAPALLRAVATGGTNAYLIGRIDGTPGVPVTLQASTAKACTAGTLVAGTAAGAPVAVTTDGAGYFGVPVPGVNPGDFVAVQVASPVTTPLSMCLVSSRDNDSWPKAFSLDGSPVAAQDFIDAPGKARWYRFSVTPGQRIQVALTGLPADYNLVVFKDIGQAYLSQFNAATANTNSLLKLTAEYAPTVWSPTVWSPTVWSPDAYSPAGFSPSAFSPTVWSPTVWSPTVWSPTVWSPGTFDPSQWPPPPLDPNLFPEVAQAFSVAQTRSVIGVTVTPGTGDKSLVVNTWNNTGNFYVRVAGRGDAFDTGTPFTVSITKGPTTCTGVTDTTLTTRSPVAASGLKTVILTDSSQLALDDTLPIPGGGTLRSKLAAFAARSEIMGVVVDVAGDARVGALKQQAAANPACPFAKNLVAQEIKGIVDTYAANPLQYVVIVGNDAAIPFFRSPDTSGLGDESSYVPPVQSNSASDASLRLDFVLSQDRYGSKTTIALPSNDFPVPALAVGRLIETPIEIAGIIDAYVSINGVVVPGSSLVTGYDFLAQAANAVTTELQAGIGAGGVADSLVTPDGVSPQDPASWTASQLAAKLFGSRHDVIFLAGHFSANSALAADFSTSLITTDLAASQTNFTNSIVFSAGCHSGYNLVDGDAIPGVTLPLDWAQTFARKKATLIAGTGYQYGDTDFIKYSEQIYLNFARQLRAGTGVIAIGAALVAAKLDYLVTTPDIRGIPEKALLEATLYGLPMLGVNMPAGRGATSGGGGVITPVLVASGPAHDLGLMTYDFGLSPSLTGHSVTLKNLGGGPDVTASYLSGPDGVASNPGEPVLPLAVANVTPTDSSIVLRGIGFRGGTYTDSAPMSPFTAAPTTELRGVHVPFLSPVFYPARMWSPNYFGALSGSGGTDLLVTPAQHRAANIADRTSTERAFSGLNLRLFYSGNLSQAALSEAPAIVSVDAQPDAGGALFAVQVVGDPAAAIAQVWITYTGDGANAWTSLDLTQCVPSVPNGPLPATCRATNDSRLWTGRLASVPTNLKYVAQAVNGVGLVALDDKLGAYYGVQVAPPVLSTMAFVAPPVAATIGDSVAFTVQLTLAGSVAGRTVTVSAGGVSQLGTTAADGTATVSLPVGSVTGTFPVTASFAGDDAFDPSSITTSIVVSKAVSTLTPLVPAGAVLTGVLGGTTAALQQDAISFSVTGPAGPVTISVITDYLGRAVLPPPGLPAGDYTATQASFGGDATYAASSLTISPAQSFTVAKTAQSVTFDALAGKTFGDPDFTLYATASSGLPVSYTASGACTVAGNIVHITGPGSCTITAGQAGDSNYGAATSMAQTFTIATAPTVVSLVRAGPSPTMGNTVTYTLTFSEAVTGVASGNFAIVPGGVAAASVGTISGAGATWTVTVNTGRGTGTLHLDVVSGAGITNTAGAALAGTPFTGETYQIDKGGTVLGSGEGKPVASFGNGGYALFSDAQSVGVFSAPFAASHFAVLADGRILAAGMVGCVALVPTDPNSEIYCTLQLARYSPSGVPDASFGTNGRVLTAVTNIYDLSSLIVNADGTFFVNGTRSNGTDVIPFAAKFTDTGTPVATFGTNGLVSLDSLPLGLPGFIGSAIDGSGRIVFAGTKATGTPEGDDVIVARLTSLGAIDTTFGSDGVAQFAISTVGGRSDRGTAAAVQPDGRIVVGGRTFVTLGLGWDFLLLRLDTNGALDPSFGSGGIATTRFTGSTGNNFGRKLVLQPDGKIVLVGGVMVDAVTNRCGVARFNSNGTLDAAFGAGGQVLEPTGCFDVSQQADGKLVVVADDQVADVSYATILRLLPTGAPDAGFGTDGFQDISGYGGPGRVAFASGGNLVTSVVIQDPADGVLKSYVVELAATLAANHPPVANAGSNQNTYTNQVVQLIGSCTDADSDITTPAWSFAAKPTSSTAALSNSAILNPTFTPDLPGSYQLQLICNDSHVDSSPSTATITVSIPTITLTLAATDVVVNQSVGGTITLGTAAPAGGLQVTLTSGNTAVATVSPSTVTIDAGATTGSFTVTGVGGGTATITGSATGYGNGQVNINVPTVTVSFVILAPGQTQSFHVGLTTVAPTGGITINLTSSDPGVVTVPASVFVPEGATVPAADPVATAVGAGYATITGTATGYAPGTGPATVAAPVQWTAASGGNDHWYQFIYHPNGFTWQQAWSAASGSSFLGTPGYLATVTSQSENDFLYALAKYPAGALGTIFDPAAPTVSLGPIDISGRDASTWLGGSDAATEGTWRWVNGPETGSVFWVGTSTGSSGGAFAWWDNPSTPGGATGNEPNNTNGSENYLQLRYSGGRWNDAPSGRLQVLPGFNSDGVTRTRVPAAFLVEYSAATAAVTFTVTNTNDGGAGSLRDAIIQANLAPGPNTIDFAPGVTGTILLTSGQLQIGGPLSIVGPGAGILTIDGNANRRIFGISNAFPACPVQDGPDYPVSISGLRLTNGNQNFVDSSGGAIWTEHTLALDSVIIDHSIARSGGGVAFWAQYPGQSMSISNSKFLNNTATDAVPAITANNAAGGGLMFQDKCTGPLNTIKDLPTVTPLALAIANSEFRGNTSQPVGINGRGGAIRSYSLADITIVDTAFVDNHVIAPNPPIAGRVYQGGGIHAVANSLLIYRSEISENSAYDVTAADVTRSGGLHVVNDAVNRQSTDGAMIVEIVNSTVSGNVSSASAGAMLVFGNVALEIDNSTVNGNSAAPPRTGGIVLSTGSTYPASTNNAAAPTLTLVSSILGNNSSDGGDVAVNSTLIPAFGINAFNSLIQKPCANCTLTTIVISGPGNLIGVDPMVAPLGFNGGTTRTHALLPGSPAINTGSNPLGLTTDQRGDGFPRVSGAAADMGAYESP